MQDLWICRISHCTDGAVASLLRVKMPPGKTSATFPLKCNTCCIVFTLQRIFSLTTQSCGECFTIWPGNCLNRYGSHSKPSPGPRIGMWTHNFGITLRALLTRGMLLFGATFPKRPWVERKPLPQNRFLRASSPPQKSQGWGCATALFGCFLPTRTMAAANSPTPDLCSLCPDGCN